MDTNPHLQALYYPGGPVQVHQQKHFPSTCSTVKKGAKSLNPKRTWTLRAGQADRCAARAACGTRASCEYVRKCSTSWLSIRASNFRRVHGLGFRHRVSMFIGKCTVWKVYRMCLMTGWLLDSTSQFFKDLIQQLGLHQGL